jgi:hypothetical protein
MRTTEQLIQDTKPFPDDLVQHLPPRGDSYVPWHEYAQRLLVQHPNHSYRVTSVLEAGGVWAVAVEFDIDGVVYAGVGADDSPQAAESNAYKRALAHAGIGLHLYDESGYWLYVTLVELAKGADDE